MFQTKLASQIRIFTRRKNNNHDWFNYDDKNSSFLALLWVDSNLQRGRVNNYKRDISKIKKKGVQRWLLN